MFIQSFISSVKNLAVSKSRCYLTISGIAIGTLCVVLISSIGDVGNKVIGEEINSLGIGSLLVYSDTQITPKAKLTEKELLALRESNFVKSAIPIMAEYCTAQMRGLSAKASLWGVDSGSNGAIALNLKYGRLINKSDITSKASVCVVDEQMAKDFYGRVNIVGKSLWVTIEGVAKELEIIGIVSSGGMMMQTMVQSYIPYLAYTPYSTLSMITGGENFNQIALEFHSDYDVDIGGESSVSVLSALNGTDGYYTENMNNQKEKFEGIINSVTLVLSVIAGVSLLVSGLSIMTIMLITVKERTREIGIKKAIGATNTNILIEFLLEAFTLSFTGVIIGGGTAVLIVLLATNIVGIEFSADMFKTFSIMAGAVLTGVVFGVYPAISAAQLNPVESLRQEY